MDRSAIGRVLSSGSSPAEGCGLCTPKMNSFGLCQGYHLGLVSGGAFREMRDNAKEIEKVRETETETVRETETETETERQSERQSE